METICNIIINQDGILYLVQIMLINRVVFELPDKSNQLLWQLWNVITILNK